MNTSAGRRRALLVATGTYNDQAFRQLRAPGGDARQLAGVLSDPAIGDYEVLPVRQDCAMGEIMQAVGDVLSDAGREDQVLLYFSGHGMKDDDGHLYLPSAHTVPGRLASTAVSAQWLRQQLAASRSRRIMVWLDCCFAGAFPPGATPRAGEAVDAAAQLGGTGCVVMTSSSSLQYAYEQSSGFTEISASPAYPAATLAGPGTRGAQKVPATRCGPRSPSATSDGNTRLEPGLDDAGDPAEDEDEAQLSVFTRVVVEGLRTGDADRDLDGEIGAAELYDYVRAGMRGFPAAPALQNQVEGELHVAHSVRGPIAGTSRAGLPGGRLLTQVTNAFDLEVQQPLQAGVPQRDLPALPPYLPREHDRALAEVVQAAAGGRSAMAVLAGGSSTGKARACWEALTLLRSCPQQWRLWHPIDPEAALRELPLAGPRTVIWLNGAQLYLGDPAHGLGRR